MKAFFYGIAIQLKLDIRSKTMLISCYAVPLLFFGFLSGIFTAVNPTAINTLIPSMSVFVITMSALIGLPQSLAEVYGSDIKKVYKANGVPNCLGIITQFISSFIHTQIVCLIIFAVAPFAFGAALPSHLPLYFCSLMLLTVTTLAVGCVLGLSVKGESKLTMVAMILFLPSIMLSGIMFPAEMLPKFIQNFAYVFPATLGFQAMTDFRLWHVLTLVSVFAVLCAVIALMLKVNLKK